MTRCSQCDTTVNDDVAAERCWGRIIQEAWVGDRWQLTTAMLLCPHCFVRAEVRMRPTPCWAINHVEKKNEPTE